MEPVAVVLVKQVFHGPDESSWYGRRVLLAAVPARDMEVALGPGEIVSVGLVILTCGLPQDGMGHPEIVVRVYPVLPIGDTRHAGWVKLKHEGPNPPLVFPLFEMFL
jgi:hypothetical protein